VIVDLTFDFFVELQFFAKRLPVALMSEIGKQKNHLYNCLNNELAKLNLRTGFEDLSVDGKKFRVFLASDTTRIDSSSNVRPLRVTLIERL